MIISNRILDQINTDTRMAIANALRAAADVYDTDAEAVDKQVSEQFKLQATEARSLADDFENC